ncbi:MAG TPA: hypothetical protein VMA35_14915 [Candidatus Sulfopaludibacter sp.]|nr:hypothetical protein [Candidatus Sulfopaludibacter sp.]
MGFLIGTSFSLIGNDSWPTVLWHAGGAALLVALLARWWSRVWLQNLQDAIEQRRRARFVPATNHKPASKP